MLILQHKIPQSRGIYIGQNPDNTRWRSVNTLAEARKFRDINELLHWIENRIEDGFGGFPPVELVEIREVPNPQYEVVKVIA